MNHYLLTELNRVEAVAVQKQRGLLGMPSHLYLTGLRGGLRGACGDMAAIGEVLMTDPRTRDMPGGLKLVPTVWFQRAVNALLNYEPVPNARALAVDGNAGPATLNAAKAVRLWSLSTLHPVPVDPAFTAMPAIADSAHIAIPSHVHDVLNNNVRVADPVGSTVGACDWSAPPRTVITQTTQNGETVSGPAPSGMSVVSSVIGNSFDVTTFVVPAVAFIGAAALGVGLSKLAQPRRRRA